jgi:hypothetical protein
VAARHDEKRKMDATDVASIFAFLFLKEKDHPKRMVLI